MDVGHDAVAKIQEEEIKFMDDLEMVDKYFINQLIDNLKHHGIQIIVGGAMVVTLYFKFGTKLQMRLEYASNLV